MDRQNLTLALATAALVPSIFAAALPPLAVVRGTTSAHNPAAWNAATATAAGAVLAAATIAQSREVLVLGGVMAAVYAVLYRSAITGANG